MISKDEGLTMVVKVPTDKANLARAWMLKPEKQSKAHVGNLSVIVVLLIIVQAQVRLLSVSMGQCR